MFSSRDYETNKYLKKKEGKRIKRKAE